MNSLPHETFGMPIDTLHRLTPYSQSAVVCLSNHKPEAFDLSQYPTTKLAAVLVLLYEKDEHIQVLLTTRSKNLRSHPGQTALPGGKCDRTDSSIVETAYREAHEEVGLPRNSHHVHTLCLLRPFLSLHGLVVTPIVAFSTDLGPLENLTPCEGEVDAIFQHPLEALLDPKLSSTLPLVPKGSENWPYEDDFHNTNDVQWLSETSYRMHRFRSTASPIKGLTSDILIMTAELAFGREPIYDRWAQGQLAKFQDIARLIDELEEKRRNALGIGQESQHASPFVTTDGTAT